MAQTFPYTFTCEQCGGTFYSKVDPSGWKHHKCNACSGKQYKDYPVANAPATPTYQPKPVPTAKPVYNNVQPAQVAKKEFNLEEFASDLLLAYGTIKLMSQEAGYTIPEDCLCAWATSAMIQKQKF